MERPTTPPHGISRRAFVAIAVPLLLGPSLRRAGAAEPCAHDAAPAGPRPAAGDPHPTPRPGVNASRVLAPQRLADATPSAVAAFEAARRSPQVLDGIRCHCGCAGRDGNYSLLSCFEGHGMAIHCERCQGQARLADRLHRAGRSLDEIRTAVDERYG